MTAVGKSKTIVVTIKFNPIKLSFIYFLTYLPNGQLQISMGYKKGDKDTHTHARTHTHTHTQ
jgi:hypothetical protein